MKSPLLAIFTLVSLAVLSAPRAAADAPAKGVRIFELKELDQLPVPIVTVAPDYPDDMRKFEISGQVMLDFIVDANGDVRDAHPFSSTQYRFEDNAVKAVSQWKFKPGKWHGRSVTTHVRMPIKFTLSDKDREL